MATINGTFNSLISGTLSGTVATPGATGPAGPTGPTGATGPAGAPGVGVPAGGTTGQFLSKSSNADYATGWTTLSLSDYLTKANNLSDLTNFSLARDNLSLGTLNTPTFVGVTAQGSGANVGQFTSTALTLNHTGYGQFTIQPSTGITFPDASVQTTAFPAGSDVPTGGLTGQALVKLSNSNYDADWATIAGLPTGGTVGQVLTKNSGTNFDASFATLIPGDRYLSTSTTSLTINNANKTLTIGTGLSYTPTQSITISYDASNHMHGEVLTYNSGTGVLTVDINHHTGSGTYASWVVNVGGVVPAASVAWGSITGTLGDQTDLATALNAKLATADAATTYFTISAAAGKANLSGATFTGKVNTTVTATTAALNIAPQGTAPSSTVAGDVWIATNINYRDFNGTAKAVANTNTSNTYTAPQIIQTPVGTVNAALRVTQLGTGNAIQVEDSTTPDATAFVVDQFGKVGVGIAPDSTAAIKVDSNGIMFGDGTTQITAAGAPVTNNSQLDTTVNISSSSSINIGGGSFPRNSIIRMTYDGNPTVILNGDPGSFYPGDQVIIVNETTSYITFAADGLSTVLSPAGYYSLNVGDVVTAIYLGGDTWVIYGRLTDTI